MIRKPEGRSGASSANEASMGAKMSSAQVPTAFSSTPLQSCNRKMSPAVNISSRKWPMFSSLTTSINCNSMEALAQSTAPLIGGSPLA
nr:hypothetical protein Iba_chr04dCG13820 [Ipomoea batatas]